MSQPGSSSRVVVPVTQLELHRPSHQIAMHGPRPCMTRPTTWGCVIRSDQCHTSDGTRAEAGRFDPATTSSECTAACAHGPSAVLYTGCPPRSGRSRKERNKETKNWSNGSMAERRAADVWRARSGRREPLPQKNGISGDPTIFALPPFLWQQARRAWHGVRGWAVWAMRAAWRGSG